MLSLTLIKRLLQAALIVGAVLAAGAIGAGAATTGAASNLLFVVRLSSSAAFVVVGCAYAGWRWVPAIQQAIFPYIGGTWVGTLRFESEQGAGVRSITLQIKHTLLSLHLLLESDQSTSNTLAVHAEKNGPFEDYRLYYVYLNSRKETVTNAGQAYRGLAILQVKSDKLEGHYFTERNSKGSLSLVRTMRPPWWQVWA